MEKWLIIVHVGFCLYLTFAKQGTYTVSQVDISWCEHDLSLFLGQKQQLSDPIQHTYLMRWANWHPKGQHVAKSVTTTL